MKNYYDESNNHPHTCLNIKMLRVLFLLFFFFFVSTHALNICGGTRDLADTNIGEICDSGGFTDCPFGTTVCGNDSNTMLCLPNCSITVRMVLDKNDTMIIPKCENGGYWDFFTEKCVCPASFLGGLCQLKDECYGVSCGGHGSCTQGFCACESDYVGVNCETHRSCRSFNLEWTGSVCQCAKGWAGDSCDQCSNSSVCVPNKNLAGYTLLFVQNSYFVKALLETPAPPKWSGMQPYKPTPDKFQCQCNSFNSLLASAPSSSLIEGIAEVSRVTRASSTSPSLLTDNEMHPYIEDFFEHHHNFHHVTQHNNETLYVLVGFFIFILIFFVIIYYLCYYKKSSSKKKKRTTRYVARSPSPLQNSLKGT